MAKRFTDRNIWESPTFCDLTPVEKCAFFYLKDRCDAVGVWEPNYKIAEAYIGEKLDWNAFREKWNSEIYVMENGKWWLVGFCDFQYGELSKDSKSKPILFYIDLLEKHGLWELYSKGIDGISVGHTIALVEPYEGSQEKDKEKEKEKEKDNIAKTMPTLVIKVSQKPKELKKAYGEYKQVHLTDKEYQSILDQYGISYTQDIIKKLDSYKEANGKTYKNDMAAIRQWVFNAVNDDMRKQGKTPPAPQQKLTNAIPTATGDTSPPRWWTELTEEERELKRIEGQPNPDPIQLMAAEKAVREIIRERRRKGAEAMAEWEKEHGKAKDKEEVDD